MVNEPEPVPQPTVMIHPIHMMYGKFMTKQPSLIAGHLEVARQFRGSDLVTHMAIRDVYAVLLALALEPEFEHLDIHGMQVWEHREAFLQWLEAQQPHFKYGINYHEFAPSDPSVEATQNTEKFKQSPGARDVRCAVGSVSFYIQADGSYYPCLTSGQPQGFDMRGLKLGNVRTERLTDLRARWDSVTRKQYCEGSPCLAQCPWKLLNLNMAAHVARSTRLTIP